MSNEIIPTGGAPKGLTFLQNRELANAERTALLGAAIEVADHRRRLVANEVANAERIQAIHHTEERGHAALGAASRVIDAAIEAVGDDPYKSHQLSKIVTRTTNTLAELA